MASPTTRTRAWANCCLEGVLIARCLSQCRGGPALPGRWGRPLEGEATVGRFGGGSQLFDAPGRIGVPGLAAGTLPEMLLGFEAAGGAAVAGERLGGVLQRALHVRMELLVLQLLAGHPLGRGDERRLALQVLHVPLARGLRLVLQRG